MKMLHLLKEFVKKCLPPFLQDWLALSSASRKNKLGRFVKLHRPCRVFCSSIGDYSYIGPNSHVSHVKIGKFCSIGPRFFAGWGIHPVDGISTAPMFYSKGRQNGISLASKDKTIERKPIEIGNDVFIGVNVTVLDGVRIGDGAVIAAGAVVASDVMPYSIVGGVPAKEIRKRFTDDEIAQLLEIKWWNFSDDKLRLVEQHFNDLESFVKAVSREGQ